MGYKPAYIWNGSSFDQIGNQAVASLNDYALLSPVVGQTLTNTTLTSASLNSASVAGTISGNATVSGAIALSGSINGGTLLNNTVSSAHLASPAEKISVSATAATGTVTIDCKTQTIVYYTTSASANWTMNFRGDSGTTMNSFMAVNESLSVLFLATQGATAYYPTVFQIDGVSVTPKWSGGTAPNSGNASSVDAYSFTIVKTASATYTVFAGQGQFK